MSVFIKGLNRFIKGMKMPKLEKTYKVRLYKAVDGRIIVTACGIKDNLLRPVGEVIEIKTPHGRLIDADALINELASEHVGGLEAIKKYTNADTWTAGLHTAWRTIDDAPTVIEAEGES